MEIDPKRYNWKDAATDKPPVGKTVLAYRGKDGVFGANPVDIYGEAVLNSDGTWGTAMFGFIHLNPPPTHWHDINDVANGKLTDGAEENHEG